MKKIIGYIAVAILMIVTYATYIYFSATGGTPDEIVVSKDNLQSDVPSLGNISDGSYPNYTTEDEVNNASSSELFTITADAVKSTDSYIRKGWVSRTQKESKKVGRRVRTTNVEIPKYSTFSFFTINKLEYKTPMYIITLADGSEIGAIIEPKYVSKLEKGENTTLPIGKKIEISNKNASRYFNDANIKYIYYALNNEWYSENADAIKRNAIIYAVIVLIALGGLLAYFGRRLFSDNNEE